MKNLMAMLISMLLISIPAYAEKKVLSSTPKTSAIYRDVEKDATNNLKRPVRLKLSAQEGLSWGRMAGVWGSLGGRDKGDAFFLGKTPDHARIQFTLTAPQQNTKTNARQTIRIKIRAKDGKNIVEKDILAKPGETQSHWFRLKGKITVLIETENKSLKSSVSSLYAAYFWYPGDRLNGMAEKEFAAMLSGKAPRMTSFMRRKKE